MHPSPIHKIYFGITLLMVSFPVWSAKLIPILIFLWVASSIFMGFYHQKTSPFGSVKPLLIQSSLFVTIAIWAFLIDRSNDAHFYVERSLSLLIFPVGFYFNPIKFNKKQLQAIQVVFSIASFLIVGTCSFIALNELINEYVGIGKSTQSIKELVNRPDFHYLYRHTFEKYSGLHPTYASIYLGMSSLFSLNLLLKNYTTLPKKGIITGAIFIVIMYVLMAFLASRTPFAATIFVSLVLVFLTIKKKIYIAYILLITCAASITLYLTVPSFSERFSQISINNTAIPKDNESSDSFNLRSGIMYCSITLIKNNWLMGVGPGKVQEYLDNCYNDISPEVYQGREFNTHNQFLGYWAGMGIVGLITFLLILMATAIKGFQRKNYFSLLFILFLSICFLTENIMVRQQGIVAVALFINLFYFYDYRQKVI